MTRPPDQMPPRLLEGEGEVAELLRKVERQARQAPSEAAAWERTLRRLGRDSGGGRVRVGLAAAAGALVGAVALYLALSPTAQLRAPAGRSVAEVRASARVAPAAVTPSPPSSSGTSPETASPASVLARDLAGAQAAAGGGRRSTAAEGTLAAADIPHIHLGRAAVGLPAGRTELLGEADVMLSRGGAARAFATPAAATVALDAGEVELHVEKRPPEARHAFEVTAGGYRFTALGTTFRVARANGDVTLSVTEGRVAVSLGTERLIIVTTGGFWAGATREPRARRSVPLTMTGSLGRAESSGETGWSGPLAGSVAPGSSAAGAGLVSAAATALMRPSRVPSPLSGSPVLAAAPPRPSQPTFEPARAPRAAASGPVGSSAGASSSPLLPPALFSSTAAARSPAATPLAASLASSGCAAGGLGGAPKGRSAAKGRIDCLLGQGRGADLGAEVALYEAARLYRDALGDPPHAIATLRELRRRFPSGALAAEADLSLAELLPAVGRYREALAATAAVLGAQPTPERVAELHLLRGDLLRTGLGDCQGAAAEYAQVAELGPETAADPASFFAGVCLQKLGDAAGARRVFERYLTRPHPRRAAEAGRRLLELDGPGRLGP